MPSRISPSIDKLTLTFDYRHRKIMSDVYNLILGTIDHHIYYYFDFHIFKEIPKEFLSFKQTGKKKLYTKKELEKNPKLKYRLLHLITYEDPKGRKIHLKFKCCPISTASISIDFFPTVDSPFDSKEIMDVFTPLNLKYKDFLVSNIEFTWDFYGETYKNILKCFSSKGKNVFYCYKDKSGKTVKTSNPLEIDEGVCFTTYIGAKYGGSIQIKGYNKRECKKNFKRIEISFSRSLFKKLGIRNLDDLAFNYETVINQIFSSFKLVKLNRKKFIENFPRQERFLNKLSHFDINYKIEVLHKEFGEKMNKSYFKKKYLKTLPVTETCQRMMMKSLKNSFFKMSENKRDQLKKEQKLKKKQSRIERKIKSKFVDLVKRENNLAIGKLDDSVICDIRNQILYKIKDQTFKYRKSGIDYIGELDTLIISIEKTMGMIRNFKQMERESQKLEQMILNLKQEVFVANMKLHKLEQKLLNSKQEVRILKEERRSLKENALH